ncbi:protein FAR1-RELATED SEQUENCE 5-like [Cornus florida]|uniref:protein FAR1-RELATED SEQUENCE 5-like n=1 Tax=Cornus florida TaxID=4283 RepID=UPI0028A2586A|nr:protein FAR1-RELATED SEQUENCE 5-like [Cornus florida]
MKFETKVEAYDFYSSYAHRVGFSIRKEYFNKSKKTGKLSSRLLICYKEGFRVDNIRDSMNWLPCSNAYTIFQCKITHVQAIDLELASDSGITPRNLYELMGSDQIITNILWANSKMIVDYCNFGDVSFDTTYKVEHGNRPFGSFLGLNHHRETTVFGAAFMYDETADSFVWLFQTFFKTMSSKVTKTIFTDQDAAMGKALTQVFSIQISTLCISFYIV